MAKCPCCGQESGNRRRDAQNHHVFVMGWVEGGHDPVLCVTDRGLAFGLFVCFCSACSPGKNVTLGVDDPSGRVQVPCQIASVLNDLDDLRVGMTDAAQRITALGFASCVSPIAPETAAAMKKMLAARK